jgi:hypothetical protein
MINFVIINLVFILSHTDDGKYRLFYHSSLTTSHSVLTGFILRSQ